MVLVRRGLLSLVSLLTLTTALCAAEPAKGPARMQEFWVTLAQNTPGTKTEDPKSLWSGCRLDLDVFEPVTADPRRHRWTALANVELIEAQEPRTPGAPWRIKLRVTPLQAEVLRVLDRKQVAFLVRLRDLEEPLYILSDSPPGGIATARFSADGKHLFTLGEQIGIWDASTGKLLRTAAPPDGVTLETLTPDGKLAAGLTDKGLTAAVWDVTTGKKLAQCKGHTGRISSVGLSPDGSRVATGSDDRTVKVWDARTGKLLLTLKGHTYTVASVRFSPDGKRIATGSYAAEIKVWDAKTGAKLLDLKGMSTSNNPTSFSADGSLIVSPRYNKPAVWATKDGKLLQELKGHVGGWCRTAEIDLKGNRVVSSAQDKTARVFDVKTGQLLYTLVHDGEVSSAAFSPDGSRVVTVSNKVRVWAIPAQKK
jgi:WD40 repeat protein